MIDKSDKKIVRQYFLSVSVVRALNDYVLGNKEVDSKSEVVEMSIKEFLKSKGVHLFGMSAIAAAAMFNADICHAGFDVASAADFQTKIGGIIKLVAGIVAPVILALGLLIGGIKYHSGDEEALSYIKGGIIGSLIAGACWSIANWLMN